MHCFYKGVCGFGEEFSAVRAMKKIDLKDLKASPKDKYKVIFSSQPYSIPLARSSSYLIMCWNIEASLSSYLMTVEV